jgi:alkanesulfonate monooxygenase SsuD/methylene tetrahydromethanopterin reductase-like flavin-dependent oxidoreductase (luciferase family)
VTPAGARAAFERLDEARQAIGRDPGSVRRSVLLGTVVGATPSDAKARLAEIRRVFEFAGSAAEWEAEWGDRWLHGTPEAVHAAVRDFAATGADRLIFQDFLFEDLDMVDLLGELARAWTSDPMPGGMA